MRYGLVVTLAASLLVATAGIASAAEPSPQDIAQARDLSGQAQQLHEAGNYAEAEKNWIAASNLYPSAPTLTLGLARTQAKLGKLVLSQENYQKIIREQTQSPSPNPAFKDALESAKAEVGAVSARIASVVIILEGGAQNPTVTIDGNPVSAAGLGLKRPVDPGAHTVRAEAAGYKPAEAQFQVAEAGSAEAKLKMEKAPDAPGGPALGNDSAPVINGTKSNNKTYAIVAFGVGGAGLVFGAITGLIAMGKHSDLESQCNADGKCPPAVEGDVDSYKTMGTLSTVGFIVGGVGLAAGAVLWFTAPKENAASNDKSLVRQRTAKSGNDFTWHPYVGVGGGGISGRF